MKVLAFDGQTGTAGDMILGALVAAGADPAVLEAVEDALPVEYDVGEATRAGIVGTEVTVRLTDPDAVSPPDADHHHGEGDADHHHDEGDAGHDHDEADAGHHHGEGDADGHPPAEGHGHTRTYPEVVELVESMALPGGVREDALRAFEILGEAEATIHGTDLEETAFHEVGADDAVADVVGAALLIDDLEPDSVVTTPVAAGGGEVATSHGRYPVPPPAVVEIAARADWELRGGPVEAELLTPTGAAILAAVADGVESLPAMRIEASGYGTGTMDLAGRPNVLRAVVGERRSLDRRPIAVLETNVDDASPEVLGGLQETLAEAGAKDVTVVPTTMKKSRPGHLVKVVVDPGDAERVARRLAAETGTLGVRQTGVSHRFVADRSFETATLEVGRDSFEVPVKVATDADGRPLDYSAEYDDAAAVAAETGLPVREVMRRAEDAVRDE
jgi:uncharacterized protein (TIGR00299 family) protein